MNLIKNIKTKQIVKNFQNFDYSNYLNTDINKEKSSISDDFTIKFIEKNKNFEDSFIKKMKIFWMLQFLGFFAIIINIIICTTFAIIIFLQTHPYSMQHNAINYGAIALIPAQIIIAAIILFGFNFKLVPKISLDTITNRIDNFKTFELLFYENQFKNFDLQTGPYEFQLVLLLKGSGNLMKIGGRTMRRFADNYPNIISCMYLSTKMLLYYFENSNKIISNKEGK